MVRRVEVEGFHPHALEFLTFGDPEKGPRVLITGGIHGGEATGVFAAQKVAAWLEGRSLKGAVTVLPVANPGAFRRLTRTNPYDELDMNRIFPGKANGSPSMATANAIWEVARGMDFIVDLHCCGIYGSDYTLALWQEFPVCRDLAARLDIHVVIESGGTRQQLFVEAAHAGIPAVIIELAGGQLGSHGGIINRRSAENAFTAVSNLLIRLGVADGTAPAAAPTFYGKLQEVSAQRAGLWAPAATAGEQVTQGQVLGQLNGEPILCPVTGVATTVRWDSFVFAGHHLANVAPQ